MKKLFMTMMLAAALSGGLAWAHGDEKARHGGLVQISGETKFELVPSADGAEVYLDDHGETIPTAKVSGKLTVMSGAAKTEARLEPAPGDKLVARGVKLVKGDKVIALVTLADKTTSSARFVVK